MNEPSQVSVTLTVQQGGGKSTRTTAGQCHTFPQSVVDLKESSKLGEREKTEGFRSASPLPNCVVFQCLPHFNTHWCVSDGKVITCIMPIHVCMRTHVTHIHTHIYIYITHTHTYTHRHTINIHTHTHTIMYLQIYAHMYACHANYS